MTRSRQSLVLQGFFRAEQFRGAVPRAEMFPPASHGGWRTKAPRPELLPAGVRGASVQPRRAAGPGARWPGAPRPALLPGMGAPRGVAQPRSNAGISTVPVPAGQLRLLGEGRPLDPGIRQVMETAFRADFSTVRVHEGPAAHSMGALAFTLGEDIHFAPGLYDPDSRAGVALLGHELTHVVQQRDGRVVNPYGHGVAIVQDPALEAEADRMGQQIADSIGPDSRPGSPATRNGSAAGRRNPVQTSAVMRWAAAGARRGALAGSTAPIQRMEEKKDKKTRIRRWDLACRLDNTIGVLVGTGNCIGIAILFAADMLNGGKIRQKFSEWQGYADLLSRIGGKAKADFHQEGEVYIKRLGIKFDSMVPVELAGTDALLETLDLETLPSNQAFVLGIADHAIAIYKDTNYYYWCDSEVGIYLCSDAEAMRAVIRQPYYKDFFKGTLQLYQFSR